MLFLWIFGDTSRLPRHFTYLFFYLTVGLAAAATHILLNQGSRLPSVAPAARLPE